MPEAAYLEISRRKLQERDAKIPSEWRIQVPDEDDLTDLPRTSGVLSERELDITERYDSVELLECIRDGKYSAAEVTQAFCKRAAIAQQALNCLTEIFFDRAVERAAYLDDYLRKNGKPVGPLHGLPVALKDSINVAGVDSTIGMAAFAFDAVKENSVIVDVLLALGAVLYVKTNVPQSMMTPDTENNVFGRSRNARSRCLTAAGSSGGLGALLGMRGALMGIGTDVGGSVRIPAYCNGVYAIKPSSGRLPYHKLRGYLSLGAEAIGILCVNGVMAISMRDCDLLLRTVSDAEPWLLDPGFSYLPWDNSPLPDRPLVIGIIVEDHETSPLPPLIRIMRETCDKLRAAGHEVVEMDFYKCAELAQNAVGHFKVEGGKALDAARAATGEPYVDSVAQGGLYPCEEGTLSDLFALTAERLDLQTDWLSYWASTARKSSSGRPVDAILCPPQTCLPRPHDTLIRSHFSRIWNVLDYPAAIVQCGVVDLSKDDIELPPARGPMDARVQSIYEGDKRKRYSGFPIGLQLVGQRQMEPKLSKMALLLDKLVRES
ncbi:amidase [Coniochaeta ligniaria NRRL 30616]|uniref:Amidase n=1 Tax=Coniochaeta ligniaria NRRL 30616 TaxID=1408157 RepID=A0A1J7IM85_9PEZI|nr:amidase [Coniochaeta ligniaria NRRL 30616]